LDSSHQDKSNGSKFIMIGAIFVEIMHLNYFYKKFRVGSGRVNYLTRPGIFGLGQSGTRIIGSKFGALFLVSKNLTTPPILLIEDEILTAKFEM